MTFGDLATDALGSEDLSVPSDASHENKYIMDILS
jgi:hypothetical protein